MRKRSLFSFFFLFLCLFWTVPQELHAQAAPNTSLQAPLTSGDTEVNQEPNVLTKIAVIAALALMPYAIMMLTSFLKMVVVLSLLRNALGTQQSPPNQAINGIALLMAIYVMFPTGLAMYNASKATSKIIRRKRSCPEPPPTILLTLWTKPKNLSKTFCKEILSPSTSVISISLPIGVFRKIFEKTSK